MTKYGTILRIDNLSSFGSAGGVHVKFENGGSGFLAGCYFKPSPHAKLAEDARVEILDNGRHWTVLPPIFNEDQLVGVLGQPVLHPDSHPEPPPMFKVGHADSGPGVSQSIPRQPRTLPEAKAALSQPSGFDLMMAAHDRTNDLLAQILAHLKDCNPR